VCHADIVLRSSWTTADRLVTQRQHCKCRNNARPHYARTTREKMRWEALPHPPCIPHLSACDYHVFGLMKKAHKSQFIAEDGAVQEAITSWLQRQPQDLHRQGIDGPMKLWDAFLNQGAYAELPVHHAVQSANLSNNPYIKRQTRGFVVIHE
jgi:hypothetical protein